jgi:hypothetical protein
MVANEDSDCDGISNQDELLLGREPGDKSDVPPASELRKLPQRKTELNRFLTSYRWQPFESVHRPPVPKPKDPAWQANPIDAFLATAYVKRGLTPRPPASRVVLLRRVSLDLTGLAPTPDEIAAFESDRSPDAYEKVVNRLLASPRFGERWARHWMDVWRYSDWAGWADGNQIRDSKPFIWRWRDWIVESLNADKGYDRMVMEMLAADELCPEDQDALRATGFLVRNFKLLSREQWLEDTMNHTSKAFLGVTMHCAKCHNHMYDPIMQSDYYRMRAIFEPHNVRTDRVPGQPDVSKDGLVHAFDAEPAAPTYLFVRGDERNPDKSHVVEPGIPASLGGTLAIAPVNLPLDVACPDRREFVIRETLAASQKAVDDAESAIKSAKPPGGSSADPPELLLKRDVARARHAALLAELEIERLEETGKKASPEWERRARAAVVAQRQRTLKEAEVNLLAAQSELSAAQSKHAALPAGAAKDVSGKSQAAVDAAAAKIKTAEKALADARTAMDAPVTTAYTPRALQKYPAQSTGRRLAFARWLTDKSNPLAARVAVNHIWARHFGQGLVPSASDFGRNGRAPSHPELLDWLAAQLMSQRWTMKDLHRLIVTSRAYRLASTSDPRNAKIDPDDVCLWRFPTKRMEAEIVRDNVLYAAGSLDETRGGPEIDHALGLTTRRRSLYLRTAAEKQSEFLQVFDGPSVTECYERRQSVMPQQALALANSELTQREARKVAADLSKLAGSDDFRFVEAAFLRVLARHATGAEMAECRRFLTDRASASPARANTAPSTEPKPSVVAASAGQGASAPPSKSAAPGEDAALRARSNLILVLYNHSDFVTIR